MRPLANYLTIAEVARAAGVPVRTMRSRLARMHQEHGDLLHSTNARGSTVRKWLVNVHELDKLTRKGSADEEWRESLLVQRIEELEMKVTAQRKAHLKLKLFVAALVKRLQ